MHANKIILASSPNLSVEKEWERTTLIDLLNHEIIFSDEHFGEVKKAIISVKEDWCVLGGEGIVVWKKNHGVFYLMRSPTMFIHDLKKNDDDSIKILVDPWSDQAAVWLLDITTLILTKIKDGPSLVGQPYVELINF